VSAALGPGDGAFLRWVKGPWRVPDAPPAPKEFCRRGLRGGAKNSDDPTFAVPKPMSGQCHGDIVAWNQEKSHLERRDDAHAVKRGQSRVERQNFHFARDFGKVSLDEAVSEMDQQFGVKRSSALTLAHAAGEGGILKWYAPRDESERLAASAPPPPVPRADVSGAAGGAEVDSELRFLVLTYLLLDARNASSIMFWIDDIIRCCWGMEAAPAFAVPSLRRCIWNSQVGSPGFGWW